MDKKIMEYCDHPDGIKYFVDQVKACADRLKDSPEAIFVEVGNYRGGSALGMLEVIKDTNPERWMFTVDPYGSKPFKVEGDYDNSDYGEHIYRDAMKLLTDYAFENELNYYHWRMMSDEFMKVFPDINFWHKKSVIDPIFGCVYIDGEHTPEQVAREVEFYYKRMPSGGLIILDDTPFVSSDNKYTKIILDGGAQDNWRTYYVKT